MKRLVNALFNSIRAFRRRRATKRRSSKIFFCSSVRFRRVVRRDVLARLCVAIGILLVLILVEVLNSGIEAACNAVSREFNTDIQLAKDCGSLAVLIAMFLAAGVWGIALIERLAGIFFETVPTGPTVF